MGFLKRPIDVYSLTPVESAVLAHLGAPGRILDIGCGLGEKTESFRRMGWLAAGLDHDAGRIGTASTSFGECSFFLGTSEQMPVRSGTFDAVFSLSTLQYVDPARTIGEAWRILKPGGKAVFIENLAGSPMARAYRLVRRVRGYRAGARPKGHLTAAAVNGLFGVFSEVKSQPFNLTTTGLIGLSLMHESITRADSVTWAPEGTAKLLHRLDSRLVARWPALGRYAWLNLVLATK